MIEENGYVHENCLSSECVRGGGLSLILEGGGIGRVELKDSTQIKNNLAYAGRSVYIDKDVSNYWSEAACQGANRLTKRPPACDTELQRLCSLCRHHGQGRQAQIKSGLIDENYPFEALGSTAQHRKDTQATLAALVLVQQGIIARSPQLSRSSAHAAHTALGQRQRDQLP